MFRSRLLRLSTIAGNIYTQQSRWRENTKTNIKLLKELYFSQPLVVWIPFVLRVKGSLLLNVYLKLISVRSVNQLQSLTLILWKRVKVKLWIGAFCCRFRCLLFLFSNTWFNFGRIWNKTFQFNEIITWKKYCGKFRLWNKIYDQQYLLSVPSKYGFLVLVRIQWTRCSHDFRYLKEEEKEEKRMNFNMCVI